MNLRLAAGILIAFIGTQQTLAQGVDFAYPTRPVSVIIPYSPGGTSVEARLYTDKLSASLGRPFVLDFRPGAGSSIGSAALAKAVPDGYTLMMTVSSITVIPNFFPVVNHSVIGQIVPITQLSSRHTGIIASVAGLPPTVNSLTELLQFAKSNPGKLSCNTSGTGGSTHIVCIALAKAMGIEILPVHYKGVAQGQVDLIAGRTQVSVGTLFTALPHIKAGKLKVLAITGPDRSPLMPTVSTTHEQGFDVDYPSWLGAFAPPRTSVAIVNKLNAELVKAVKAPDVVAYLEKGGAVPVGSSPDVFRKMFDRELAFMKQVIEENKIESSEE